MKALTLWQPWAGAIAAGLKKYETRSWPTRHRGWIAIHASVRIMDAAGWELVKRHSQNFELFETYGKVICVCELLDCIYMTPEFIAAQSKTEIDFGDWRPGRYAWKLGLADVLHEPIPARGLQCLWNFDMPDYDLKLF
ncbi:MAG: ASCH domain-containing protein [Rickettsiales bacterium]|jgi:hypothetical protein|nr:ASCH domain-containing protein [Rickettsiales bacterium]